MKKRGLILSILFLPLISSCINNDGGVSSSKEDAPSSIISSEIKDTSSEKSEEDYTNAIFFDSSYGEDGDGSKSKPFSSLSSISYLNLVGGEKILLRKGSTFFGNFSLKNIHGSSENPILISSYGEGAKPKIIGQNQVGDAILSISNCSYLTIDGLEITDSSSNEADRRGVLINLANPDSDDVLTYSSIHLNDLYIHDIYGISDAENTGMSIESKKTGGILLWSEDGKARSDDLRITNCKIENVSNVGIASFYQVTGKTVKKVSPYDDSFQITAHTNLLIENNDISYIAKNAIFLRNAYKGVVRGNTIHDTATTCKAGNSIVTSYVDEILVEKNEGYRNMATTQDSGIIQDGAMLDPDLQSKKVTFQYNYSHDNSFGLFLNCNAQSKSDPGANDEIILRYNVSINDYGQKGLVYVNYYVGRIECYNNTFISSYMNSPIFLEVKNDRNIHYFNNLVYSSSSSPSVSLGNGTNLDMTNNVFYSLDSIDGLSSLGNNFDFDPEPKNKCADHIEERVGYEEAKKYITMKNEKLFKKENCISVPSSPKDFLGNAYKESIGAVNSL